MARPRIAMVALCMPVVAAALLALGCGDRHVELKQSAWYAEQTALIGKRREGGFPFPVAGYNSEVLVGTVSAVTARPPGACPEAYVTLSPVDQLAAEWPRKVEQAYVRVPSANAFPDARVPQVGEVWAIACTSNAKGHRTPRSARAVTLLDAPNTPVQPAADVEGEGGAEAEE